MARDSSGVYTLPLPPVEADEIISASWANTTLADIAQALTESVPVDGSAPITGQTKIADGSNAAPGLAFNAESSTGLRRPEANTISIVINGTERARIKNGNLILGSIVDGGERLQITGNSKFTGNVHATGTLTVEGASTTGAITASGTVQATRLETTGLGNIVSGGNVVSGGTVLASTNLMGQRVLVNQGSVGEPSINLNGYGAGFWFPTSGEVEVVGDGASVARFGTYQADVNNVLNVRGAPTATSSVFVGKNRTDDAAAEFNLITSNLPAAGYNFRLIRNSGVNGTTQFQQKGSGRINFELDTNTEFRYSTVATSGMTLRYSVPNLTAGANLGTFGVGMASTGAINHFIQDSSFAATNNYYAVARNAAGGIANHTFRVGGDVAVNGSSVAGLTVSETNTVSTVPYIAPVGTEASPTYSFNGDVDTGMFRSASNQLDFSTGGVRRMNIDASGRLYAYSTGGDLLNLNSTVNNGLMQITTTTGTANINNFAWYLTSSGSAILLLRNDAKTAYVSPITVQRNAASGTSNVSFRVGGDANVNSSDLEAGRFVVSPDGTQGKLLVGHTAQDVYLNNADASPTQNFQIHSYKTGGNGPVSLLGTDGTNTSYWASARTNTASKRVIQTQIGGVSVSSTAGAERGRLDLATKAAADAGVVVRCSIDETAAAFNVPVTASNLSYATKVVSASLVNDGITSIAAGLTINTSDCAAGRVFQIYNNSAASITITQGAGLTMRLVGTATTGNRTIAQRGLATFTCITGTELVVEGAT